MTREDRLNKIIYSLDDANLEYDLRHRYVVVTAMDYKFGPAYYDLATFETLDETLNYISNVQADASTYTEDNYRLYLTMDLDTGLSIDYK